MQYLTETNSEIIAQVSAQTVEIKRFQESEAASCLERNDLQERLRQAYERVHELEQTLIPITTNGPLKDDTVGTIVSFSEIHRKLSPQRAASPSYDPGDFAMLFMSDDMCPSSPFNVDETNPSATNFDKGPEASPNKNALPARGAENVPGSSPTQTQSPAKSKRKAVNFKPQLAGKITERTSSARSVLTQVQEDPAERPNKVKKHVQKWTYSRIRSSGTEIQHEQPAGPSRVSALERRTSPKGLVSASSGNKVTKRGGGRGRGRRRSRGGLKPVFDAFLHDLCIITVTRRALQFPLRPRSLIGGSISE